MNNEVIEPHWEFQAARLPLNPPETHHNLLERNFRFHDTLCREPFDAVISGRSQDVEVGVNQFDVTVLMEMRYLVVPT